MTMSSSPEPPDFFDLAAANARVATIGTLIMGLFGYHAAILLQWLYSENPYGYLLENSLQSGFWSFQSNSETVVAVGFCAMAGFIGSEVCFVLWCLRGETPIARPRPGWFQLHLATLLVLTLCTAFALYLGITARDADLSGPGITQRGWPIAFMTSYVESVDPFNGTPVPASTHVNFRFLLRDSIFYVIHLAVVAFLVEAYLRRRDHKRSRAAGAA
jgi:hypothetical protein